MKPRAIHPTADLFPMMPEDELAELAADIKANGLMHPIVTDADDRVVDGRNRLRACELAGVEPRFARVGERDITAYIVSHNINRRHLTRGQRAMALAMIYPEPAKAGRRKNGSVAEPFAEISKARLSLARAVLRWGAGDLAPAVMNGSADGAAPRTKKAETLPGLGD